MIQPAPRPQELPPVTAIPKDIVVLIGGALMVALGFGLIAPILPQYAHSFGVSNAAAAAIVSVFAFTRLGFAPFSGRISEKIGEPAAYIIGVLIVAGSSAACGFAPGYWPLIIARSVGGIGSTMFSVASASFIARRSPAHLRGRISSLYGGAFLIGNVAGPLVGGVLSPLGYRAPFLIYAVTLTIAAAIVFFFIVGTPGRRRPREAVKPAMSLRAAWAQPAYRAAVIGNFGNGWMTMGVRVSLVPLFAALALGMSPLLVGMVLTAFALGNVGALTFSGRWSDAVGRRRPIMLGMSVAAAASAVFGLASAPWVLIALSLVAGLGTGTFNPSQQATVSDTVGPDHSAGRVMATYQMAADFPAILAPLIAGWIADTWGYAWAFGLSALVLFSGVIAWGLVRGEPRQAVGEPVPDDGRRA